METFGWQLGIWGAFCLVAGGLFVVEVKDPLAFVVAGLVAAIGLGLTCYEAYRRRNRTVLMREAGKIAVYRKGSLDLLLVPGEVSMVKVDLATMLKIDIPLGMCAIMFTLVGVMGMLRDQEALADNLMILYLGLTCGASLGSLDAVPLRTPAGTAQGGALDGSGNSFAAFGAAEGAAPVNTRPDGKS